MRTNNIELILNIIALICSALALILDIIAGINITDPMLWLLIAILLSSIVSIVKINLKPQKKDSKKRKK